MKLLQDQKDEIQRQEAHLALVQDEDANIRRELEQLAADSEEKHAKLQEKHKRVKERTLKMIDRDLELLDREQKTRYWRQLDDVMDFNAMRKLATAKGIALPANPTKLQVIKAIIAKDKNYIGEDDIWVKLGDEYDPQIDALAKEKQEMEGDGRGKSGDEGLSEGQIDEAMKDYPEYLGTIAVNEIPTLFTKAKQRNAAGISPHRVCWISLNTAQISCAEYNMSSEFVTKKLNNEKVRLLKQKREKDTRPVKGASMFPQVYGNIFALAQTNSGKTVTIGNIIQKCHGPNTSVIVFCSTIDLDPNWEAIRDYCDHKGIPFVSHSSIKNDDGVNELALLVKELSERVEEEDVPKQKNILDSDDEDEPKKKKKYKYQAPDYIFVFDDVSDELRDKTIPALVKKSRHFKAKVILSSQWLNDLHPGSRKQIKYFLLFRGQPLEKLQEIHKNASLNISLDDFNRVYKFATEKPYSFLYVDCIKQSYRRNFDTLIEVS